MSQARRTWGGHPIPMPEQVRIFCVVLNVRQASEAERSVLIQGKWASAETMAQSGADFPERSEEYNALALKATEEAMALEEAEQIYLTELLVTHNGTEAEQFRYSVSDGGTLYLSGYAAGGEVWCRLANTPDGSYTEGSCSPSVSSTAWRSVMGRNGRRSPSPFRSRRDERRRPRACGRRLSHSGISTPPGCIKWSETGRGRDRPWWKRSCWREAGPSPCGRTAPGCTPRRAARTTARGLYKVWLRGGGKGRLLLGTLVPEGGELVLSRTLSRRTLEDAGCWPVAGGRAVMAYPFTEESAGEWYWEEEPWKLVSDPVLVQAARSWGPLLVQRGGEEVRLAASFRGGGQFPLVPPLLLRDGGPDPGKGICDLSV